MKFIHKMNFITHLHTLLFNNINQLLYYIETNFSFLFYDLTILTNIDHELAMIIVSNLVALKT
jgi:hypothetical protein